ncbi:Mannitol dehydrogenase family protein [Candidatus Rhodobacter oscarellae]|uniref:Mannitol dehydrogenase family protein n=1 Tax=Candidatus Rhodobacter oscarellae TaxID=1675527 RepID=A0A0J9E3F2_9RHOB|nr:mannitol dehydrogenase family protein [Candidatus Rhodobacter lobularis]KMW57351.1 Mannitol dehydrogenase family protein [Candidatus Rhodobacter lobularis]
MNLQTQPRLDASTYDRDAAKIGIVHLGYGAFHRAHMAVYLDAYMQASGDLDWGIAAVNLRGGDSAGFVAAREARDGYLLKTTSPEDQLRYQLIRPHVAFEDWAKTPARAEELAARESVHIISMTVTESGYFLDTNGDLDREDPTIAAEIAGGAPASVYGYLTRALTLRAAVTGMPVTILCCDNIRENGRILERSFLTYLAALGRDDLAEWVRENATFPCSMVDRITPRTSETLIAEVTAAYPGRALAPIHGESFIQWVVEDRFAGPRPDLAQVGVQVVADVHPYEEAKIRILNGGHTGLCYLGALAGHQTFDQAMLDPALRAHFDAYETENVLPGLALELPFDRHAYLAEIAARFGNRAIADDLARICMDGWTKMQVFIRPTLEGCLAQGISPTRGYDCVASWYVYARRIAAGAMPIPYTEPFWDTLAPLLAPGQEEAMARSGALWADLPETYPEFAPGILTAINEMEETWPA